MRNILTALLLIPFAAAGVRADEGVVHDPANAVANLDVHPQLDCTLFASEPMFSNPSNMDIDHRGRVWVCEIYNYRAFANPKAVREEGDRILILTDHDHDGKADDTTVFYQGPDLISPHGICVLPTPDGKGTQAIVSAGDSVRVFTDTDGDDKADGQKIVFSGIGGAQHDHGIHAFVFGPDGKFYFNFGNAGKQLKDADGNIIVDKAGNKIVANRKPYQEGLIFRCDRDFTNVETLAWNFRNNWEVAVDSFGGIWQSDNDDDGNRGARINFVLEYGNYGYRDERTGAGWQTERTGMHPDIPSRHWHVNDPGVVPNLLQTGAGSPTGILVYEGSLLPKVFQGEMIHCDAGPSICRAYPVEVAGAGYTSEIVNILDGQRNNWFRPSDVCVAPDGSLFVADWYDPGVGGHRAGDLTRGRLFRVTAKDSAQKYKPPQFDFATTNGCIEALRNPNLAMRYIAWLQLHSMGKQAEPALAKLAEVDDPRVRARALWLLGKMQGRGQKTVSAAMQDDDSDVRSMGVRLARQIAGNSDLDIAWLLHASSADDSPHVRRECAIALADLDVDNAPEIWAILARQHDGKDRWYLEALGIAARGRWDACLATWLDRVDGDWNTPAGRDIIWRSRAKRTPELLAKIIQDEATSEDEKVRYFRAFDFLSGSEKQQALQSLLDF